MYVSPDFLIGKYCSLYHI